MPCTIYSHFSASEFPEMGISSFHMLTLFPLSEIQSEVATYETMDCIWQSLAGVWTYNLYGN